MNRSAAELDFTLIPAGQKDHHLVLDGEFEEIGRVWKTSQGWQSTVDPQTWDSSDAAARHVAAAEALEALADGE